MFCSLRTAVLIYFLCLETPVAWLSFYCYELEGKLLSQRTENFGVSYSHHPHSWPRVFSCPFQMILSSASPSSFLERRQSYDLRVSIANCSQNEKHHSHIYSSSQWPCWDKTLLLHVSAASLHGLLHSSLTTRQEVLPTSSLHVCPVSRSYFSFFLFLFKLA